MIKESALLKIIEFGSLSELKKALKVYPIDTQDAEGMTLLAWASIKGDEEKVSLLLKMGANPNISCNEGMSPLMYAAANNHAKIIQKLLEKGADLEQTDRTGWGDAEIWASLHNADEAREVLRTHRKKIASQSPNNRQFIERGRGNGE